MSITKPMLAPNEATDIKTLTYPIMGTPKYDGIRAITKSGVAKSRKFKDLPNLHIQSFMKGLPDNLDGEIMVDGFTFNQIQSAVMRSDGTPDFKFYVFDYIDAKGLEVPYLERMKTLGSLALPPFCRKVLPVIINNEAELLGFETAMLAQGFEGAMLRSINGPYKCGRATLRQGWLLKLKRFMDSEAVVVGFEEQMENTNEKTVDELGHSKRSKHQAGMVGKDTLGKFLVQEVGNTPWNGLEFAIGTGDGLTADLRQHIWDNREEYLGKIITYKYQPHGTKDLPRIPVWKGFRDPGDIGE
jgi:DNA ligase 1